MEDTPESDIWILLSLMWKRAVVKFYTHRCSFRVDRNKLFQHIVIYAVFFNKIKDLFRESWRASALTEISWTSSRFSSWLIFEFRISNSLISWILRIETIEWIVDTSIRILKVFDFESTSTTFMTRSSPDALYKFTYLNSLTFLEIQIPISRNWI